MAPCIVTTIIALLSLLAGGQDAGPANQAATQPAATQPSATQPAADVEPSRRDWIGVYASTSEIKGFAGSVLVLESGLDDDDDINYRLKSYSDVRMAGAIKQDEERGTCLTQGRTMYLPRAWGWIRQGEPRLRATIERWTLLEINGRRVLMRDDALRAFREDNTLYDYGILIKVQVEAGALTDLGKVEHPSIKVLYTDPDKPWKDPYVHGANDR